MQRKKSRNHIQEEEKQKRKKKERKKYSKFMGERKGKTKS
jgi:hypothetical protein